MEKEDVIKALEKYYGIRKDDWDWDRGCYLGNRWLSLESVVEAIETYCL